MCGTDLRRSPYQLKKHPVFVKPILVWDIGVWCSPLSLLLYQSPFLLNPQTRLLCCNLFFKFMYVFFNVVFCTLYFLQPAFSTFVFCIFQSAFSSQRYLPTEPPSSHFYLLNSHRPTRRAAFKHKGFTRGLPIDVALNVSLQMPSFPFHIGRNPPIQTTASILVVCKMWSQGEEVGTRPEAVKRSKCPQIWEILGNFQLGERERD